MLGIKQEPNVCFIPCTLQLNYSCKDLISDYKSNRLKFLNLINLWKIFFLDFVVSNFYMLWYFFFQLNYSLSFISSKSFHILVPTVLQIHGHFHYICDGVATYICIYIRVFKYFFFSSYNFQFIFRADMFSFMRRTTSPFLSFTRLPIVLSVGPKIYVLQEQVEVFCMC